MGCDYRLCRIAFSAYYAHGGSSYSGYDASYDEYLLGPHGGCDCQRPARGDNPDLVGTAYDVCSLFRGDEGIRKMSCGKRSFIGLG